MKPAVDFSAIHRPANVMGVLALILSLAIVLCIGSGCASQQSSNSAAPNDEPTNPTIAKTIGEGHFLTQATVTVDGQDMAVISLTYDEATGRAQSYDVDYGQEGYKTSEIYSYGADNQLTAIERKAGDVSLTYTIDTPTYTESDSDATYSWTEVSPSAEENAEANNQVTLHLSDKSTVLTQEDIVQSNELGSTTTTITYDANKLVESMGSTVSAKDKDEDAQSPSSHFTFSYNGDQMTETEGETTHEWTIALDDDGCLISMKDATGRVSVSFEYQSFTDPLNIAHFDNQYHVMQAMVEALTAESGSRA